MAELFEDVTELTFGDTVLGFRRKGEALVVYMKETGTGRNYREVGMDLGQAWEVAQELQEIVSVGYREREEDEPAGLSDADADADTLASAGWGTDEDYGGFDDRL